MDVGAIISAPVDGADPSDLPRANGGRLEDAAAGPVVLRSAVADAGSRVHQCDTT